MLKWLLSGLIFLAFLFAMFTGRMEMVNISALKGAQSAVELTLTLIGTMALWSGLMNVAQEAGICRKIGNLLSPIICFIFKGVRKGSHACELISMNIAADMLGLANAATPLGIAALTELSKNKKTADFTASNDMIKLVIVNTASIQLIPTTVAILRLKYGASSPLDIVPAVLISSAISLILALIAASALSKNEGVEKDTITDKIKKIKKGQL